MPQVFWSRQKFGFCLSLQLYCVLLEWGEQPGRSLVEVQSKQEPVTENQRTIQKQLASSVMVTGCMVYHCSPRCEKLI